MRKFLISLILIVLVGGVSYFVIEGWNNLGIIGIKDIIKKYCNRC